MRKKLLSFVVVAAAGTACFAVFESNTQAREFTDLELANIEALTQTEIASGEPCYKGEYNIDKPMVVSCEEPRCMFKHLELGLFPKTSYCP